MAEAEPPDVGQHADADRPALRHQRHVACQGVRIAHLLHVDGAPVVRIEDTHAVGSAQRNPGIPTHPHELGLTSTARVAVLGEAAVVDHGPAGASIGDGAEALDDARVGDAQRDHVRLLRQLAHVRIAALSEDLRVLRIDRVQSTAVAEDRRRLHEGAADRRALGGAQDGDRAGTRAGRQVAWADLRRMNVDTRTPSTTALTRSVETTAITGSDSRRMLSYIFLGRVAAAAASDENHHHGLVERGQEREQGPHQHARPQHGQGDVEERPEWTRARAHGGALEVPVEALERRRDDEKGDRHREDAVGDHDSEVGAGQPRAPEEAVVGERAHHVRHDQGRHHQQIDERLAAEAVPHVAEGCWHDEEHGQRRGTERDDEAVQRRLQPLLAGEVLHVVAERVAWRRELERDRGTERHGYHDRRSAAAGRVRRGPRGSAP